MELEVREVTGEEKTKLINRLKAYTNEMKRFDQDLVWEKMSLLSYPLLFMTDFVILQNC